MKFPKQIQSSENTSNHVQTLAAWVPKHPPSQKVATVFNFFFIMETSLAKGKGLEAYLKL